MFKTKKINWINPLDLAHQISLSDYNQNWAFLYSGLSSTIKNSKSFIGLFPQKEIVADDFSKLENELKNNQKYFGYLGYGLKNSLEKLSKDQKSFINLPNLWMINFGLVLEFDHENQELIASFEDEKYLSYFNNLQNIVGAGHVQPDNNHNSARAKGWTCPALTINSNFSKKEYLEKVKTIRQKIIDGDIYQANLTRKFFGEFTEKPQNDFEIFLKLSEVSPGNFSSFLKLEKNSIISSSPELFLKIDENGKAFSSPIKGTAPRFSDSKSDQKSKEDLQNSAKEQGENLMIVDLVRNDLARTCLPNSIKVKNLFKVTSYKTIHHMSSDILGIKDSKFSNLDLIKGCFPPGSMTGAPKIKAMEICSELEKNQRGIYSGAIGFVSDCDAQLSVVIRTLILEENKFEFQVGGAITFDSDAEKEWQETMNKAGGIVKALGIGLKELESL